MKLVCMERSGAMLLEHVFENCMLLQATKKIFTLSSQFGMFGFSIKNLIEKSLTSFNYEFLILNLFLSRYKGFIIHLNSKLTFVNQPRG